MYCHRVYLSKSRYEELSSGLSKKPEADPYINLTVTSTHNEKFVFMARYAESTHSC